MITNAFGNKVKELRIASGLSQAEIADKSGIERGQISKIEKGKINVTLETIDKLAFALGVEIKDLMNITDEVNAHPFVKWAGGKTQILAKLKSYMPEEYGTYYEPFVGGGAFFFDIAPKKAVINDQNRDLICAYRCFQDDKEYKQLLVDLKNHERNHSEEYFYSIREQDRDEKYHELPIHERAARMVYLNKSCFNGLFRVNSKGYFNVPSGRKEKVNTYDEKNFEAIKKYFNKSEISIKNTDFEIAVADAKAGDFVYFDPPYDVYPNKLGFVDYGKEGFDKDEQKRLRDCFAKLSERGVKVMLSNHNTPYINELYAGFNIHVIEAKRMINSKADGRGAVEEVIITNY